ncbi:MAG: glycine betaine ABC transporter substrate-binding protein [Cyanophyceae cyanobacterium]
MLKRQIVLGVLGLASISLTTACGGGGSGDEIKIGSKSFTEQYLLGNMYEMVLDDAGFDAEYTPIGQTDENHSALVEGDIDVYPEYTGTALISILGQEFDPEMTREEVYNVVKETYAEEYDVAVLEPTSFNNTYALVMPKDLANELGVETVSELSQKASDLTLGVDLEFAERGDGLPGLQTTYGGFNFEEVVTLDPGLLYSGLEEGEIDVTSGYGTDGQIAAYDLVVLEDDKNFWPPYPAAAFVRQDTLAEHPEVAERLNEVAAVLDADTMQRLNWEVAGNGREPDEVAREFLEQEGLLGGE